MGGWYPPLHCFGGWYPPPTTIIKKGGRTALKFLPLIYDDAATVVSVLSLIPLLDISILTFD